MIKPSLKKNYIYRILYEVLLVVAPFITTPYISRVLGAEGIGIYSYSMSIMSFFTMFAALGTIGYGTREIAQNRDNKEKASKLFWEIELLTIITSTICLIIWIILCICYKEYRPYLFALTPVLLGTMFDISWYFTGYEIILYTVFINSLIKIAGIILLFVLVNTREDLIVYTIIQSLSLLLGSLSMWIYLPKMLVTVDFRKLSLRKHFRETLIYFIPTIATTIYTVLDKTLIGLITNDNYQNGYYEQATKIITIVKTLVFTSLNTVMGARMSYLFSYNKYDEIRDKIHKSLGFIFMLGYGCVFGLLAVANNFVPVFFGPGYEEVVSLICLMTPLIIIIGISNCLGNQYFTPSGQRARSAKVIVLGAFVNLVFNVILIPVFKSQGAVIASIIAELVIAVLYVILSNGYVTFSDVAKSSVSYIIAGVIMYFIVVNLGHINVNQIMRLVLQISSGVAIYFVILCVLQDKLFKELSIQVIGSITSRLHRK